MRESLFYTCEHQSSEHSINTRSLKIFEKLMITRSRDRDHPGQHGETSSLLKIQKSSRAWWCTTIVPATQEAEAGEACGPGW